MNSVVHCKLNWCKPRRWRGKLISKRRLEGDQVGNQIGKWKEGEGWLGFWMGHFVCPLLQIQHPSQSSPFPPYPACQVVRQRRQWISVIDFIYFCSFCSPCFCSMAPYTIQITTLVVRKQSGKKGLVWPLFTCVSNCWCFQGRTRKMHPLCRNHLFFLFS